MHLCAVTLNTLIILSELEVPFVSPLCIPKLMSLFGSQRSFLRPLTARLVLPVSPHSSFGSPRVPSQLVWSSPCPLTACLVLSPSQLVWSSPCPLTACFVLPVSPHTLFGPPRVPSFPGPKKIQRPLPHVLRINFVSSSVSSDLV